MFEVSHDDISRILHEFLFLSSLDIMLEILLGYLHILWVIWVYPSNIGTNSLLNDVATANHE